MDEALGLRLKGSGWALAALAAGVAGSTAAIELGERTPAEEEAAPGSGRFQRDEQGAEQTAPAENPA